VKRNVGVMNDAAWKDLVLRVRLRILPSHCFVERAGLE
jgi:hypothetical protein